MSMHICKETAIIPENPVEPAIDGRRFICTSISQLIRTGQPPNLALQS